MKYISLVRFINNIGNQILPTQSNVMHLLENAGSVIVTNLPCLNNNNIYQTNDISTVLKDITLNPNIKKIYISGDSIFNKHILDLNIIKDSLLYKEDIIIDHKVHEYNENEKPYLDLIYKLVSKDINIRNSRNATTISCFGDQLEFDLTQGFPLLTTKKMFWRGIINELLFILRGDTDSTKLKDIGINIWNDNTTREFLDLRGLDYQVGDMGPMYGYVLRHQGYKYEGCNKNYKGCGFDQLANVIHLLKTDPNSRRIMMTTFDPSQVEKSVLAPCHGLLIQFYVKGNFLHCKMTQRSADIFLGLPFNIASYAALIHIMAKISGYIPGKLIISLGDAHIYTDHIDQAIQQLYRNPYPFPKLHILKKVGLDPLEYIETLKDTDFQIVDYKSHPIIKANMIP